MVAADRAAMFGSANRTQAFAEVGGARRAEAFTAWSQSEHFRAAHRDAGANKPLYLGHPEFEGFEAIQTIRNANARDQAA